jgi:FAD/FMN-containing dehydrogenase
MISKPFMSTVHGRGATGASGFEAFCGPIRNDLHQSDKGVVMSRLINTNDRPAVVRFAADETGVNAQLDAGPTGTLVCPGDAGWDRARAAWVVNVDQRPAAVAVVRSMEDVSAAVVSSARAGLKVTAQSTGHGATPVGSLSDTVLVRTSSLDAVDVNPAERTVWAGSGVEWGSVAAAAAEHGLAAQAGSAPDVGIAGFLLSGGISWLARSRGLAVNDVLALEIVGADGRARVVDTDHEPDLFWALRGGGGSFGVVTGIKLRLHPQPTVAAGTLFFPIPRAGEVLHAWRRWTRTVPDQTMSCSRLLQLPPLPELPPPLSGQAFVVVEVAHQGPSAELNAAIAPLRELDPTLDTINEIPAAGLFALHMDPPGPTPCRGNGMLLNDVPPSAIDALVSRAGHGSGSPLLSVELRHLGGAVATRPAGAGAVGHFEAQFVMYAVGVTLDKAAEAKVDDFIRKVEQALAPWSSDIHYANFDERAGGGRDRFHDRDTLDRLRAVKARVDPAGLFTCGHPLVAAA